MIEYPSENLLRPNGHGGYVISSSALTSWSRCNLQRFYELKSRQDPDAPQGSVLSATVYGSVIHYVMQVMETAMHEGREDALELAQRTWDHYWHPINMLTIEGIQPIEEWLPRETFGGLRERGRITIAGHYEALKDDKGNLLALEYGFAVPVEVNGRLHTLNGYVDRLAIRTLYSKPYVSLDDNKGLAIDTPIPTPDGWVTMGDLQVGDQVLGSDGHPVSVTIKSELHDRPCYRVEFDDGSEIVCDNVHLWNVISGAAAKTAAETLGIEEIKRRFDAGDRFRVLNAAPLRFPDRDLPVDPYLLGLWLGDGSTRTGELTLGDAEIWDELKIRGFILGPNTNGRASNCETRTVYSLTAGLRTIGVCGDKHVPTRYLRSSWSQRLALLQGLMDSDGSWATSRRHAVFTNTNLDLIDGVYELVCSLGWKARKHSVVYDGYQSYTVTFTPVDHNPFSLPRKAFKVDTLNQGRSARARRRKITAIEPVAPVPTQCIAVNAPDRLYLAGKQMVPTHNTGKQSTYLRYNMQGTVYAYASTLPEFWTGWDQSGYELETFDEKTMERMEHLFRTWGYRLHEGQQEDAQLPLGSRRFRWINLKELKFADGGWRVQQDYDRMKVAIDAYVRANEAGIYSVNTEASVCMYCSFKSICAGVGLPSPDEGKP